MKELSAEYIDFMQSDEWNEIRKAALRRANYECEQCGARNTKLDVHHLTYDRFGGNEEPDDLEVLCRDCHDKEHGKVHIVFEVCQTCGEFLGIFVQKMAGGWIRKTCFDGHIREKRHG